MKNKLISATLAFGIVFGAVALYGASIWPKAMNGDPVLSPTIPISDTQRMGGVAANQPSTAATKESQTSQSAPARPATKAEVIAASAPRQAEITQKVTKEYEYRALRASNDPLPQPAWVQNGLHIPSAWDTATGSGVVIADIDTGFALDHQDLSDQWYQNVGEVGTTKSGDRCWNGTPGNKSTNSCDDDSNGYIDDWRGWNFVDVNNTPQAGTSNPNGSGVSHGTETAGLVGASGNNGLGTASVAWNNRVMPLQALDDNGAGYTSGVTSAVYYAVDNGAKVINMSLGGATKDPALSTAIQYAYDHDVVVVAAAGNCGTGTEQGCDPSQPGAMGYPALDKHVIAVGALTSSNARASFSSYGPGLDVMAPGSGSIVSTMWTPSNQTSAYASSLYGTSFASPIVASYVGLLKSIRSSSSVDDITALVDATASKPTGMNGGYYTNQYGHGLLDASNGLSVGTGLNQSSSVPQLLQAGGPQSEHTFASGNSLSSGCNAPAGTYCTVWAIGDTGYDRYLPYTATVSGQAGWTWSADVLGSGNWSLRARSGNSVSTTPYQLFSK
jgi:subtilisin family serine protease